MGLLQDTHAEVLAFQDVRDQEIQESLVEVRGVKG